MQTSGVEPLVNVLEFYGGNSNKMRTKEEDFRLEDNEDVQKEIKRMNKNLQSTLVKTPKPFHRE